MKTKLKIDNRTSKEYFQALKHDVFIIYNVFNDNFIWHQLIKKGETIFNNSEYYLDKDLNFLKYHLKFNSKSYSKKTIVIKNILKSIVSVTNFHSKNEGLPIYLSDFLLNQE
jgi:hypothetical protein